MKTLDLTNVTTSQIKYELSKYPDGQQDVKLLNGVSEWPDGVDEVWEISVEIKSRMNSWLDIELILCATAALKRYGIERIHLFTPYVLGARSDRDFTKGYGGTSYLVDVVAPVINAQGYKSVKVLDPHSDVMSACINNLVIIEAGHTLFGGLFNYKNGLYKDTAFDDTKRRALSSSIVLLSPDAGSLKKIYDVASYIKFDGDIILGSKHRDVKTGKILSTDVDIYGDHHVKDIIIVDDICDGGRTFIELVKAIRKKQSSFKTPPNKIYLYVSHGIFSQGLKVLSEHFDGVITTNSIKTKEEMLVGESEVHSDFLRVVEVI